MTTVSWIGILFCLIPSLIFLSAVKGVEPYRLRTLIVGCALVLIATYTVGVMTDFQPLIEMLKEHNAMTESEAKNEKTHVGLWLLIFPAVVGSIGANLITSWFQAKSPRSQKSASS
jgi:hypothetical protein